VFEGGKIRENLDSIRRRTMRQRIIDMHNQWSDQECSAFVQSCGQGIAPALAGQIYATRLLGGEPDLALHGGGNTSCKGEARDLLGETHPALFVKASGCDMAAHRSAISWRSTSTS